MSARLALLRHASTGARSFACARPDASFGTFRRGGASTSEADDAPTTKAPSVAPGRISTLGFVAEAYAGDRPPMAWSSLPSAPIAFFTSRWHNVLGGARSIYSVSMATKQWGGTGFGIEGFKRSALALYAEAGEAIARGDKAFLASRFTPKAYASLLRDLDHMKRSGWRRVDWSIADPPGPDGAGGGAAPPSTSSDPDKAIGVAVVQGRLFRETDNDLVHTFVQFTVRLRTKQRFAAYGSKGDLRAGNPKETLLVTDHWVFESCIEGDAPYWRVASRLDHLKR